MNLTRFSFPENLMYLFFSHVISQNVNVENFSTSWSDGMGEWSSSKQCPTCVNRKIKFILHSICCTHSSLSSRCIWFQPIESEKQTIQFHIGISYCWVSSTRALWVDSISPQRMQINSFMNILIYYSSHREKAGIYPLLDVDDMVRLTWAARVFVQRLNILLLYPSHSRSHMQSQIGSVCSATCNRFIVDSRMKIECLIIFSFFLYLHYSTDFVVIFSTKTRVFFMHILKNQHTSQTSLFVVFKWEKRRKNLFL